MYKIVLPKYFALKFDRFYETPHGVDEDLASIREGGRSLDLGIKIDNFFPPKSKVVWFLLVPSQTQCRCTTQPITKHLA